MSFRYLHHPENGVSLDTFSRMTGIRKGQLEYYCRKGRIEGARFNRTIWQWRIFFPARLITGKQS